MSKMLKVVGASWLQTKISSYILGFLGLLAILALFVGQMERIQDDGTYAATVFHSEKTGYRIEYWGQSNELSEIPKGVARAYFRMNIDTTGWSTLEVETDGSYPDEIQAYAAGIVEGAITWSLIHTQLENTIRARCDGQPIEKQCERLRDALDRSVNIWKTYASAREHEDPFWHQVSLHYSQISGIFTGWKHGVDRKQSEFETDISDLYWLNSYGEVNEIQHKLNISVQDSEFDNLPGLSSAFLRIVNETADNGAVRQKLYLAHNAAGSYTTMMRIIKRYKFNYHLTSAKNSPLVPGNSVEFSGYPGSVTSQDEFYVLRGENKKMAVAGTTLRNYNRNLWKEVNITEQIPLGPRLTAANRLAVNVSTWAQTLATSNSGTGCKQWLIVDLSRFDRIANYTAGSTTAKSQRKEIDTEISFDGKIRDIKHIVVRRGNGEGRLKELLWLVEQIPTRTHSADLSEVFLENGYWAATGIPFFKDIADMSNTTKMQEAYGNIFSEALSPRAVLFKRGYKNATSLENIIKLMRQNNVTAIDAAANKTSGCEGSVAECFIIEDGYWSVLGVRGDLVTKYRQPYGVIDTKVVYGTSENDDLEFVAVSGPPHSETTTNTTQVQLNKGNVASIYTDKFDDEPNIDGIEIRDLVKQDLEEAQQKYIENMTKDIIQPFQWSESDFRNTTPRCLPDKWDFDSYKPQWSW